MPTYIGDLPPTGSGKYTRAPDPVHQALADQARRKPGQWLEARSFQTSSGAAHFAASIRTGKYLAFREERFDAAQRDKTVYIRYVGGAHR